MKPSWTSRLLLPIAALAVSACANRPVETISAPTAEGRVVSVDSLTTDYTAGGVHVIQRRTYANDVIAVNLYLLGGTQQLTPATEGIETLAFEASEYGTDHYPGTLSRRAMARTGSVGYFGAESDWTLMGFRGVSEQFDSTWAVFADRIAHPTLDSSALAVARHRLILAARARRTSPDQALSELADSVAFIGHPYALEPYGTEASLAAIDRATISRYVHEQFVTSRMLLVVVGNVSRERIEAALTRTLGTLPHGDYAWHPPQPVLHRPASMTKISWPSSTNYLLGYFQGPPVTSPDYPAFQLATELLGANISQSIRQERSLSYAANAPFLGRALATGGVYVSTALPEKVLPLVKTEIGNLRTTDMSAVGLDYFVTQFVTEYLANNGTSFEQANSLAEAQIYQGDYRQASSQLARLRHVSPGALRSAAYRYMHDMQFVYLGDTARMHGVTAPGM